MTVIQVQPDSIYLGNTQCTAVYVGNTLVRGNTPTPPQPTGERPDIDTYQATWYMDLSSTFSYSYIHAMCCSDDGHYLYVGDNGYSDPNDNYGLLANYYLSDSTYSTFTWTPSSSMNININGTRWLYFRNSTNVYSNTDWWNHWIYQISMSTWNDLTTGTSTKLTEIITTSVGQWIEFSPDGSYLCLCTRGSYIDWYELSTPRDVSTAQYVGVINNPTVWNYWNPYCIRFSPTWLKLFVWDRGNNQILQFNLSTAYDITTAVYTGKTYSLQFSWQNIWCDIFDITDSGRMFCGRAYDQPYIYQCDSNS